MPENVTEIVSTELKDLVIKGMQEKKAEDIVVLDLRKLKNAVAEFFVICSANSDPQVAAIADSIEAEVHKITKQHPWHSEGKKEREWVLTDYVTVVAHTFKRAKREFFGLENLWGDAEITRIEEESINN